MLEGMQKIFTQIQLNVCENTDITAFAVIVNLFLSIVFVIVYFSLKVKNSKLRKENAKFKSKFNGLEFNLKSECEDSVKLMDINSELSLRINELILEKQYLESEVFKKYDKIFKVAGLISDDKDIETKEIEYTRDSYVYKKRRGKL